MSMLYYTGGAPAGRRQRRRRPAASGLAGCGCSPDIAVSESEDARAAQFPYNVDKFWLYVALGFGVLLVLKKTR